MAASTGTTRFAGKGGVQWFGDYSIPSDPKDRTEIENIIASIGDLRNEVTRQSEPTPLAVILAEAMPAKRERINLDDSDQIRHIGKFEVSGEIGEKLREIVLDGGSNEQAGDVNGPGGHWYGLVCNSGVPGAEHAIVSEDSRGFFEVQAFDEESDAKKEFERIAKEVSEEESPEDVKGEPAGTEEMLDGYISAALFSTTDESNDSGGDPLDKNYSKSDIDSATLASMRKDVVDFIEENDIYISGHYDRAGHDFWLTRNRHGAGFWDGDWPRANEKILTDRSLDYGEVDLYVGDDGKIHAQ